MRVDEESVPAQEVEADQCHEREDDSLAREKDGIGKQSGLPLFHRRKPAWGVKVDDQLADDAAGEENGEESEEDAVDGGVSYDHCR